MVRRIFASVLFLSMFYFSTAVADEFIGISFWARSSVGVQAMSTHFYIFDPNTDVHGLPTSCNPSNGGCGNAFSKDLILTTAWQQYTVYFNDMVQEPGWGYRPPSGHLDAAHVSDVEWRVLGSGSYNIWIDDVYLINAAGVPTERLDDFIGDTPNLLPTRGRNGFWYDGGVVMKVVSPGSPLTRIQVLPRRRRVLRLMALPINSDTGQLLRHLRRIHVLPIREHGRSHPPSGLHT